MITKETIKEYISTVPNEHEMLNQNQEKSPNQKRKKIQIKPKTQINKSHYPTDSA